MKLGRLRSDWEILGARDPYWAVLSDPAKRHGGWDVDDFYRYGRIEIDTVLAYAEALWPQLAHEVALDFGCGPGRLTYALRDRFTHAVGVDVSESMIQLARDHDPTAGCEFHVNPRSDLSLFADDTFDFVYSRIVLQHIPPRLSLGYIGEFVRVLRPEGLALFQVPDAVVRANLTSARRSVAYRLRGNRDDATRIQVYGIDRAAVVGVVEAARGAVVHVAADESLGKGRESWLYAVAKHPGHRSAVSPEWRTP